MTEIPVIKTENGSSTFFVDGKPFIAIGGELHNSSASSTAYMRKKVWPSLRGLNLNSVIATVSWEQIEPEENKFDFSVVDDLIADARNEGVRLTLIWFGLWKNGESTYVPSWVKRNPDKFRPCVRTVGDRIKLPYGDVGKYTISPICTEAVKADAKAFTCLMKHIHEIDREYTVILVQVENEIGLLGSERDFSDKANTKFEETIPERVSEAYGVSGDWKSAFGDDAEEYFMAWYYANAVETIASAGVKEHPLPMYVNAWLQVYPDRAGAYPSGGPIAKMMKMWKLAAPSICMCSPDIYVPDIEKVLAEYSQADNPLFIPETRTGVVSASTVFLAVGKYNALGFHPFGIEDVLSPSNPRMDAAQLAALNIELSAFDATGSDKYLPQSYKLITNMTETITKYRNAGKMTGFYHYGGDEGCMLKFSEYDVKISYGPTLPGKPPAGGFVIEVSQDQFIFAGTNFKAEFFPKKGEQKHVAYVRIEEGEFRNDVWERCRILNGDEQKIDIQHEPQVLCAEVFKF